ncbi:hypothetical protein AWC38_SpisGene22833 [Stylophora pistillata]|uniref:Reverse transcriptase domain-containing protein n=1 Tax=Stylophora pistillata TaxID=50429 RepID=A0A2B4RA50_STYPI|nr:hypothetical protein AWC38_SpisGene22833 [Stylophora pistillata]
MAGFLFLLVINWVMRKTVERKRTGIRWNFTTVVEDLDFANDLALLSSAMNHFQNKTTKLEDNAAKVGLKLNTKKCNVMKASSKNDDKLRVGGSELEEHVSSKTLLEMAEAGKISEEVRRRRWNWIGHIMRKERNDDCAVVLGWTPEGRRKRDRPKTTWRRMVEKERNGASCKTRSAVRHAAADQTQWRRDVQALCASWYRDLRGVNDQCSAVSWALHETGMTPLLYRDIYMTAWLKHKYKGSGASGTRGRPGDAKATSTDSANPKPSYYEPLPQLANSCDYRKWCSTNQRYSNSVKVA